MKLEQCYQLLQLRPGSSLAEIKDAYRRRARLIHPDLHPTDQTATQRFMMLHRAYQILQNSIKTHCSKPNLPSPNNLLNNQVTTIPSTSSATSPQEIQLKWNTYYKLQDLLQNRQLNLAVAVIDGLAQRYHQDPHIQQWQGIIYYFIGQHLLDIGQIGKAKIYLQKAQKADPQNVQLSQQIKCEHQRIARIMT